MFTQQIILPYCTPVDPYDVMYCGIEAFYTGRPAGSLEELMEQERAHEAHLVDLQAREAQEEIDSQPYWCEVEGKYEFPGYCSYLRVEREFADLHGQRLRAQWAPLTASAEGWV